MATTGGGYPYPLPTDFEYLGAQNIKDLATAADSRAGTIMETNSAATTSVAHGAWTAINCGGTPTSERDPLALINVDSYSPLAAVAGWYDILVQVKFAGSTGGTRRLVGWATSNAGPPGSTAQTTWTPGGASVSLLYFHRDLALLAAGNRIIPFAYQDSGAALSVTQARVVVRFVSLTPVP